LALLAQLAKSFDVSLSEIGANDGFAFGSLYESVVKQGGQGLLVEPLPDLSRNCARRTKAERVSFLKMLPSLSAPA